MVGHKLQFLLTLIVNECLLITFNDMATKVKKDSKKTNKNWFLLPLVYTQKWYVLMKFYNEIILKFIVKAHTKQITSKLIYKDSTDLKRNTKTAKGFVQCLIFLWLKIIHSLNQTEMFFRGK